MDPITIEVIRNALSYAAEEAGVALRKSAYSHNIKERMDHSCALLDTSGNLLAQAEHIPVHLGSLPWGVKNVIAHQLEKGDSWKEGHAVVVNDPYISGTHLNDITIVKPVFYTGKLLGFSANKAHHVDVGGDVPGSISSDAISLHQEGEIIPPTMVKHGDIEGEILRAFLGSVRNPEISRGDLRAQMAAANLGERRFVELAEKFGHERLSDSLEQIISYGERRMRQKLQSIPHGTYTAEDCLEDIGEQEKMTWIRVALTVTGEGIVVDYSGTDPQVETPFNAVFGVTLSATYFAVKSIVDHDGPMNEGTLKPMTVTAPWGSLLNPVSPAPVSGGNLETSQRIADVVFKALALANPARVPAASQGSMNNLNVGGFDPARSRAWTFCETIGGGSGGRFGSNGIDGIHVNMTNTMNTPIEAIEQSYPLLFERYELRGGTGGRGKWRGGEGIIRAWKLLAPRAEVTVIGERHKVGPWGLSGGQPGGTGIYRVIRADGTQQTIQSKVTLELYRGDTLIMETPGGGGYGTPEEP